MSFLEGIPQFVLFIVCAQQGHLYHIEDMVLI